jgi:hypothetical protein
MGNCTFSGRTILWPVLRQGPGYGLKELRETTKSGLQEALFPVRNLKIILPEYQILYHDFAYALSLYMHQ